MAHSREFSLTRGQRVKARVEEVIAPDAIIVSFFGKLVRVANSTNRIVQIGEILDLQVTGTQPLEFRYFQTAKSFQRVV